MVTMKDLKDRKTFVVNERKIDERSNSTIGSYKFIYGPRDFHSKKLTITGDVLGDESFNVKNINSVLFNLAKGRNTYVECDDFSFVIYNPHIRMDSGDSSSEI